MLNHYSKKNNYGLQTSQVVRDEHDLQFASHQFSYFYEGSVLSQN